MISEKIKELEATKAKIASLEKSIANELHSELRALPAKFGYDSAAAFVKAVKAAAGGRGKKRPGKSGGGKRKRATITDQTRSEVKKMTEAGKTGTEIATSLKISLPSVQNIKKALGLVKTRK